MRKPGLGEANLGAMAGAAVSGIVGLFALGVAPAILARNPAYLVGMPILGLASMVVCAIVGWVIGGQIAFRVGARYNSERAEILVGGLLGLAPPFLVMLLGWYLSVR